MSSIASIARSDAAAHARNELPSADLDRVVGGQAAPTNTMGGGNTSTWAKIKSLVFGVDATFF